MSTTVTFAGHLADDPELGYTREGNKPIVRALTNQAATIGGAPASITLTVAPDSARALARTIMSVDFPDPPFEFAAVIIAKAYSPPISCQWYSLPTAIAILSPS